MKAVAVRLAILRIEEFKEYKENLRKLCLLETKSDHFSSDFLNQSISDPKFLAALVKILQNAVAMQLAV